MRDIFHNSRYVDVVKLIKLNCVGIVVIILWYLTDVITSSNFVAKKVNIVSFFVIYSRIPRSTGAKGGKGFFFLFRLLVLRN